MSKMCPLYIMLSVLFGGSRLIFTDVALFGGIIMAAWGQLIYLQNLGTFNTVQQQTNVGLYSIATILVGGATVQKANNKQAVIGVIAVSLAMYASKSVKKKDTTTEE